MLKHAALAGMTLTMVASAARADLSISTKPTKNVACSGGVCTANAKNANLNTADLTALLASGDVAVKTGGGAQTIQVRNGFAWTSASRLTLDAAATVGIRDTVAVQGTGAVTIKTNDGGSGGDLNFFDTGKLDFWDMSSNLTINGESYMLVGDIATLASGIAANAGGRFALARDYDSAGDGAFKKDPIRTEFSGIFEGLGHAFANVRIKYYAQYAPIGFFQKVLAGGVVRDIALSKISIVTGNQFAEVGALVNDNAGSVIGASTSGKIEGYQCGAAGLIDTNEAGAVVSRSHSSVNISGTCVPAGLVVVNSGSIDHAYASGSLVNTANGGLGGGLVAVNYGDISYAHASANLSVIGSLVGGLVGTQAGIGTIDSSFATGAVAVTSPPNGHSCRYIAAGGLVGSVRAGAVQNSYATGPVTVSDESCTGGLAGYYEWNDSTSISTSYAIGKVSGYKKFTGGFFGGIKQQVAISGSYWDIDTSGKANAAGNDAEVNGVSGLSDADLKAELPAGFDPHIWAQNAGINNGYPYLLANPPQ